MLAIKPTGSMGDKEKAITGMLSPSGEMQERNLDRR